MAERRGDPVEFWDREADRLRLDSVAQVLVDDERVHGEVAANSRENLGVGFPFPVEAEVVQVDKKGQREKKVAFYGRFGNGTREIKDPEKRDRYRLQAWRT